MLVGSSLVDKVKTYMMNYDYYEMGARTEAFNTICAVLQRVSRCLVVITTAWQLKLGILVLIPDFRFLKVAIYNYHPSTKLHEFVAVCIVTSA